MANYFLGNMVSPGGGWEGGLLFSGVALHASRQCLISY